MSSNDQVTFNEVVNAEAREINRRRMAAGLGTNEAIRLGACLGNRPWLFVVATFSG